MPDATALLSLALAAANGSVDGHASRALVAAGVTLLQRSAPLVRALSGHRSALLLPNGPALLTALAASDGHGATLLDPGSSPEDIAWALGDAGAAVVFTLDRWSGSVPPHIPCVLLDDTPRSATVVVGAERRTVDLGTHHGLLLEGDMTAAGRDEECVVVYTSMITRHPHLSALSHRDVIANARSVIQTLRFTAADHCVSCLPVHAPQSFVIAHAAPLLAGARVSSMPSFDADAAIALFEREAGSTFVGTSAQVQAFVDALETRESALHAPAFRLGLCLCHDSAQNAVLASRFHAVTGIDLNCGYRLEWDAPG